MFKSENFILFILTVLFVQFTYAQKINVDNSLSAQALVENSLQAGCIVIDNISSQVNGNSIGIGSFGFFERGISNFPFENGMVLTTGNATSAGNGENNEELNEGETSWSTDTDLETALGITGTLNATSIEFDFTSISDVLQFKYILASEEYLNNFPCQYSDGFAFLIREANTSNPFQNIALVPGTSTPVNTTTIRPNIEGFCGPVNSQFFEGYNIGDTNYNGRTTVLTATANIIPNVVYHIKLVIADQTDRNYDSAVFIEANSFSPVVELGDDFSTCANSVSLNGDINNPNAEYDWYLNGGVINGANQPTYEATESGTYSVEISIPLGNGFCTVGDEITIDLSTTQSTTPMTNYQLCDDPSNDGLEIFNLDTKNNEVVNSVVPGNYTVTYHTSLQNAENGTNPISGSFENQVSPQVIYARIIDNNSGCLTINQFQLIVNPRPEAIEPPLMEVCDDEVIDGFTTINLNENDDAITNGQANLVVSYHITEFEASNNTNPIPMPYVNDSQTDIVYASVTDPSTGCNSTTVVNISVLAPPPINNAQNYYIDACDQEYDGFAEFDLTTVEAEILNGLTNVTVTYHLSQEDALSGENPIPNPTNFSNTTQTEQIIYTRVIDNNTGCASNSPIEIHPNLLLSAPDFSDFQLCDIGNDNSEAFNLESITSFILQDIPDVTITYYETEDDRTNSINPIDTSVNYFPLNSPQTLYLTLTSPTCTEHEEIILYLEPIVEFPDLPQQTVCDTDQDGIRSFNLSEFDEQVSLGQPGYTVTYFETLQDAEDDINPLSVIYQNTVNPFTLYTRITSEIASCTDLSSFEIFVNPAPVTTNANPIIICDDDQDGFFTINLEDKISEITSTLTNISVSFFESEEDAISNTNMIITNTSNYNAETGTIIARVENTLTSCFTLENISIIVNTLPVFPEISEFRFCENNTDNIGEFLLSSKDAEILNGQSGKEVLYFLTAEDAESGDNPIDKDNNFENTENPQIIHVRVQNITDTDCYGIDFFTLNVGTNPNFNEPTDMFVCDDGSNDALVEINLNEKTAEISEGIAEDLTVTYYRSFEDFQNQSNPITENTFTNIANPQEIFVTIENGTICYSSASFIINVTPVPTVSTIAPFEDCDIDYNESILWDLTQAEINILDVRQDNMVVTFFTSEEDAGSDTNPISEPENFENTTNPQTVFMKVVNTDFNCPIVLPIELNVISPPVFNDFSSVNICDNDTNTYEISQINNIIVNNPDNLNITYYTNENDAIAIENEITGEYNYQTNNDIIYARLEDAVTECFYIYPFMLIVIESPVANMPDNLESCDDDYDERLIIDLTIQTPIIIGAQDDTFLEVTYHNSEVSAISNTNPLENLYNTTNGEIIFARVTNTTTQCFEVTQFSVIIYPLPIVDIGPQTICPENFPLKVDADTGFDGDEYLWSTGELTSDIEITEIGTYSVTVTTPNGCVTTSEFNVIISEPANIEVIETVDFSDPNNITITVTGIGDYLFQLDDMEPQTSGFFENVGLGYHTLTIIDINGCASVTKEILVIDAPKHMTPNNDGDFDTWHIVGVETLPGTVVYIFDRYGKLLKRLNHNSYGWDGTYNGNLMPASDYWWTADVKGGDIEFTASGHFALRR
ncbi:MAG: T9SS type B sorting domain-containing protein [Winogradskyella sp.]|uniref:T9SS type B sorting domain-containing protein n=1 Tax=Winogradskyella sp. TaxID=1883156 RepID=UPI0017CA9021|nr:choice-of-anchor L domain-containing protein [Winogradskyella sp.]MBT8245553.1 T9SS type B sorting domain-containing protein [Winogradskyella sp.]NNK23938.1 T9SS type B sorting domain-containing protein [Winogradskyella sp.]